MSQPQLVPTTCTIVAASYIAQARVLAQSFAERHRGERLQVLVVDDQDERIRSEDEPFDVLRPSVLSLSEREFHDMAMCYQMTELAAAVKPGLLLALLERNDGAPTVYLDPDVLLLAPLHDLAELAMIHPIVLTPRTSLPVRGDGQQPIELDVMWAGAWDLGFAAVSGEARAFLAWWAEGVKLDAAAGCATNGCTDQRWLDLPPASFDVYALGDPRYNVAYWNAHERPLEWTGEAYLVGGQPLCFFHFSGYDPRRPHLLSSHQGDRPRVLLSQQPVLARLCQEYAAKLASSGLAAGSRVKYGWGELPDGTKVTSPMRCAYRRALVALDEGKDLERPPDPFEPAATRSFLRWLASPEPKNLHAPTVPRLFWEIFCLRDDLQRELPRAGTSQAWRLRHWIWEFGRREEEIPRQVITDAFDLPTWPQPVRPMWAPGDRLHPGFLVSGYLRAELGIGEAARLAVDTMRKAGLPCGAYAFGHTFSRQDHPIVDVAARADLNTNIIWVNPDQLTCFLDDAVDPGFFAGRYTVGAWAWETEQLRPEMAEMSKYVDEVWALSEFSRRAIEAAIDKPVHALTPPIATPVVDPVLDRAACGMPDGFVFLFMFDYFSAAQRKNPAGLIEAFCRAFRPKEGPKLFLKTLNGSSRQLETERIRLAMGDRPDIILTDRYVSPAECTALVALSDCYVSLHRAEGFGLTMAEAMALGVPVIATGYSGNLDFMDEQGAFLVPWVYAQVGPDAAPYDPAERWAEPDLDAAAEMMRRVYESPEEARKVGEAGRRFVLTQRGHARAARLLSQRFSEIQQTLLEGYESPVADHVAARSRR